MVTKVKSVDDGGEADILAMIKQHYQKEVSVLQSKRDKLMNKLEKLKKRGSRC